MSCVACQVRCPLSPVRCQASCVTCHKTERVKEIATFPPLVMCILSFVGCPVSGVRFRCQVSPVKCQVSGVISLVSGVTCQLPSVRESKSQSHRPSLQSGVMRHLSCVRYHASGVMCQVSCVKCQMSHVGCHVSHVICQVSHVTDHVSHLIYSFFLAHEHPKFCKICHACLDYSTWLLFFRILVTLAVFMFSMIFQLIPPVLLPPTNYCFHDKVITPLHGVPLK